MKEIRSKTINFKGISAMVLVPLDLLVVVVYGEIIVSLSYSRRLLRLRFFSVGVKNFFPKIFFRKFFPKFFSNKFFSENFFPKIFFSKFCFPKFFFEKVEKIVMENQPPL